jgi:hypothetical protein
VWEQFYCEGAGGWEEGQGWGESKDRTEKLNWLQSNRKGTHEREQDIVTCLLNTGTEGPEMMPAVAVALTEPILSDTSPLWFCYYSFQQARHNMKEMTKEIFCMPVSMSNRMETQQNCHENFWHHSDLVRNICAALV